MKDKNTKTDKGPKKKAPEKEEKKSNQRETDSEPLKVTPPKANNVIQPI